MKTNYKATLYASYIGYITQAIINNLPALLFLTFQREFGISLDKIALLITINFGTQIVVDLLAAKYVDKIGYRKAIVAAHIASVLGLGCMCILPYFMNAYAGLVIAIMLNALGGGLIEVLISPIVEALPGDEKASAMSMLHSFYCWGHVGVVILSTLYFVFIGTASWRFLPLLWSLVPLANVFLFLNVPIRRLTEDGHSMSLKKLFSVKIFWIFFLMMVCSGAAEQAMSQWSSLFAEAGLGVSKTMGDLFGPCAFAGLMGLSRLIYGIKGKHFNLSKFITGSCILCIISYLLAVFSPFPLLSLAGCALCGLSVGILWPGSFSLVAEKYAQGGTAMFAVLALAGDVGCSVGPGLVGVVSDMVESGKKFILSSWITGESITQVGLKTGLLMAIIFPILTVGCIVVLNRQRVKKKKEMNISV